MLKLPISRKKFMFIISFSLYSFVARACSRPPGWGAAKTRPRSIGPRIGGKDAQRQGQDGHLRGGPLDGRETARAACMCLPVVRCRCCPRGLEGVGGREALRRAPGQGPCAAAGRRAGEPGSWGATRRAAQRWEGQRALMVRNARPRGRADGSDLFSRGAQASRLLFWWSASESRAPRRGA